MRRLCLLYTGHFSKEYFLSLCKLVRSAPWMSACCLPNRVVYVSISDLLKCISRGTQPKEKEHYTSTYTYSHRGRLAGRYSNHLWQLLNHLIFLRLFFLSFFFLLRWETQSSAILAPVEMDGGRGNTKPTWGVFLQQPRKHLWMWQEMRS